MRILFSNIDGANIYETLKNLNSEMIFFMIVSKTFTTLETMTNASSAASTARHWLVSKLGDKAIGNFVAISINAKKLKNLA
jgi:glucose-6-phosphate isomerase